MENKKTAVEWFAEQLGISSGTMLEQAKAIEKQRMIEFAKGFWYYGNGSDAPPCYNEDVEKYYRKTYGK